MGNCVGTQFVARSSCLRGKEAQVIEPSDPLGRNAYTPDMACEDDGGERESAQSVVPLTRPSAPSAGGSSSASLHETLRSKASASGSHFSLPLSCYVLRKTQDVTDRYTIAEQIGFGQYGIVRVAIDKRSGIKYAIKSISKTRANQDRHDYCQRIRTEVEILYHLGGHSNIVQLYDVYEDADTIHLIMELCEGGDWFDQLLAGGTFSEAQAAKAVQSVLKTLTYCHGLGVAHRDIKPENLLYTSRSADAVIKLADFGLSSMISSAEAADAGGTAGAAQVVRKVVGSAIYMSPEALTSHGANKERDVWSLGVVLYLTLSGYPPFDGNEMQEVFDAILSQPLRFDDPTWEQVSADAKDFISRMLTKDPKKRATINTLLAHPWMHSVGGEGAGASAGTAGGAQAPAAARQAALPDTVVSRLHQFAAMNCFKKEARKVLTSFLPAEEVAGLRHIFQEMDADGDGLITLEELRAVLAARKLCLTDAESQDMLQRADLNNNGVIDYEEFLAATLNDLHLAKDELVLKAFQHFDRGDTGFITRQDLKEALSYQGLQVDLDSIINDVDLDGDDLISYEEFCSCLRDKEQPFDAGLWPLLSASLSIRRSFMSSVSVRARAALVSSVSARRRQQNHHQHQRTVHFKDPSFKNSFKNSLRSVRENPSSDTPLLPVLEDPCPPGDGEKASPPLPCLSTPSPRLGRPSPSFVGPEISSGSLSMLAPTGSQVRLSPFPGRFSASGEGSLGISAPASARRARASEPGGGAAEGGASSRRSSGVGKGEVEARVSSRRGSALMRSVMIDGEQMQGIMASMGSVSAAAGGRGTPRLRPPPSPLGAPAPGDVGRGCATSPGPFVQGAPGSSKLRACDGAAPPSTITLPPIHSPNGPAPGCRDKTPTPRTPRPPSARPSRPSSRSHPGTSIPSFPIPSPSPHPAPHVLLPPAPGPGEQASCRGRSPGVRVRRSLYTSLGRSPSRSRPSRQASRASSRGSSRGPSRGASRGPSCCSSRASSRGPSCCSSRASSRGHSNAHSRASSRGSLRALSRSPSQSPSRLASEFIRTVPSASSPQRLPRVPSPPGPNPSGGRSRANGKRGGGGGAAVAALGAGSSSSSMRDPSPPSACSRSSLRHPPSGKQPEPLAAGRLRSELHGSPDTTMRLLARMASSRNARARNNSLRELGGSQMLMAQTSLGRPSSAMLASILTEWENELYPPGFAARAVSRDV